MGKTPGPGVKQIRKKRTGLGEEKTDSISLARGMRFGHGTSLLRDLNIFLERLWPSRAISAFARLWGQALERQEFLMLNA
jgi:hypothetical protein